MIFKDFYGQYQEAEIPDDVALNLYKRGLVHGGICNMFEKENEHVLYGKSDSGHVFQGENRFRN